MNIIQPEHIPSSALKHKYAHELHCNEVSLLPYYVASMNIEHAYFERMKQYEPFERLAHILDRAEMQNMREEIIHTLQAPGGGAGLAERPKRPHVL